MENATDATELWEYYYDYVDPVTVDETKLSFNKYLMAIIFWMVLSVFVGFLFVSLNLVSKIGTKNNMVPNTPRS
ncbi:unnamed protein product [Knipowitschia caucasica]